MIPKIGGSSPWGSIQHVTTLGPGLYIVETARHGGVFMSGDRLKKVPRSLRVRSDFYPGGPWFEEDCEIWRAALAFPEEFRAAGFCAPESAAPERIAGPWRAAGSPRGGV